MVFQANGSTDVSSNSETDRYEGPLSVRPPRDVMQALARIDPLRALGAIASEWIAIFAAMYFCDRYWHPILYVLTIMFIGGRQHALAVLQHDGVHYRLLPNKFWNNVVSEALLSWPIFISNHWFRTFHFSHHRYVGDSKDGNRKQYQTHTPAGQLTKAWTFPKSKSQFAIWAFIRISGIAGLIFLSRSPHRLLANKSLSYRFWVITYFASIGAVITWAQLGQYFLLYWLVPLCTWCVFINFLRIAGEHSAVEELFAKTAATNSPESFYALTRTTIPSVLDQIFIVPRNISYHVEHHLFPQVPFYRLPDLHRQLMAHSGYKENIHLTTTYQNVVKELMS